MRRVSVDFFWRRADPSLLGDDLDGDDLDSLVPYWFDSEFAPLRAAGIIVGVEGIGQMIFALLELADLDVDLLPDDLEPDSPGALAPDEVTDIASVLAGVDPEPLVEQFRTELAEAALERDQRPLDVQGEKSLADDIAALKALFTSAAAAGEAVIVTVVV